MPRVSALLISSDGALPQRVRAVLESIGQIGLEAVGTTAAAETHLLRSETALVIAHLASAADRDRIGGILKRLSLNRPTPTIVLGERGLTEHGLALLRLGAADYLERPWDFGRLWYLLDTLTARSRYLASQDALPAADISPDYLFTPDDEMGRIMEQVRRVALVDTRILLQGETGTGKTRLAHLIHDLSPRRDEPLLAVNCASLAPGLIESELFGHVRGAFTGADRDRVGKLVAAGRGTVLLDEVDALPVDLQAKLLRVVEERKFEPVGSNESRTFEARLIAASNRRLDDEVAAGKFRSDLFFRLNVVTFALPPLRERPQIVPAMVERFVREFALAAQRKITALSPEALAAVRAYHWPGNVRELRNAIERAVALRLSGIIEWDDLPDAVRGSSRPSIAVPAVAPSSLAGRRDEAEANHIAEVLRKNKNNRLRTAAELGISRMTLYKKLHRYGFTG